MLFLDEIQFVPDWPTRLKHQVDLQRGRRIAATGSASPLREGRTESGVGRWQTIPLPTLSRELDGINRQSVNHFLDLFEATHLIYRLRPFGYGKEGLRGRSKVYLADAALPGAVLPLGGRLLEKADRLGAAVETAFFKHIYTRYYPDQPTFSYWQDKGNRSLEVDLIAETGERLVPFEVKNQDAEPTARRLKGLRLFLEERGVEHGYAITQRWEDFGVIETTSAR